MLLEINMDLYKLISKKVMMNENIIGKKYNVDY